MRHLLVLVSALAACTDGAATPDAFPPTPDAPAFETCEGACQETNLSVSIGGVKRQLERAFYGVNKDPSGATLHIEAHRGGATDCPTESSPTPDYTLVLGTVPVPTSTTDLTSAGSFLDFVGDVLTGPAPVERATTVTLTPVAARICPSCVGTPAPSHADGMVALDVSLAFASGTITGHLYATHCDSMDSFEP